MIVDVYATNPLDRLGYFMPDSLKAIRDAVWETHRVLIPFAINTWFPVCLCPHQGVSNLSNRFVINDFASILTQAGELAGYLIRETRND